MRSIDKAESRKDAFFILDSEQSRVTGNGSCNNFFGTYEVKAGDQISFGKNMGSTMMACPDMSTEITLMALFQVVESYVLEDDVLWLNKANGRPVARFNLAGDGK